MRVLMVEDAQDLGEATQARLKRGGIACDLAGSLAQARDCLDVQRYDAVILDINLPDGTGTDLLKAMRRDGRQEPVLMLTARLAVDDKIGAFGIGADDYMVKPFDHRELEARLHVLVRREAADRSGEIALGALVYNPLSGSVRVGAQRLDLTRREFTLLGVLLRSRGQILSKERLIEALYAFDDAMVGDNAIELYVARLRKKLADSGVSIRTHRGLGYALDAV